MVNDKKGKEAGKKSKGIEQDAQMKVDGVKGSKEWEKGCRKILTFLLGDNKPQRENKDWFSRKKKRPTSRFFRQRIDEHGLTNKMYPKFAMIDYAGTEKMLS